MASPAPANVFVRAYRKVGDVAGAVGSVVYRGTFGDPRIAVVTWALASLAIWQSMPYVQPLLPSVDLEFGRTVMVEADDGGGCEGVVRAYEDMEQYKELNTDVESYEILQSVAHEAMEEEFRRDHMSEDYEASGQWVLLVESSGGWLRTRNKGHFTTLRYSPSDKIPATAQIRSTVTTSIDWLPGGEVIHSSGEVSFLPVGGGICVVRDVARTNCPAFLASVCFNSIRRQRDLILDNLVERRTPTVAGTTPKERIISYMTALTEAYTNVTATLVP